MFFIYHKKVGTILSKKEYLKWNETKIEQNNIKIEISAV